MKKFELSKNDFFRKQKMTDDEKQKCIDFYVDYCDNYITMDLMAKDYNIFISEVESNINIGRSLSKNKPY